MRSIDRGIVDLITKLNNAGYKTVASCSGMREDHPRGPRLLEGYISFNEKDLTTEQQEKIKTVAKAVGLRVWESPPDWKEYVGTSYRGKSALAIYIPESESLNASLLWHKFEDALFGGKINPEPDKALYFGEKEKLALSTIGGGGIDKPTITKTELGGIIQIWVRLPNRASVVVATGDEQLDERELIERAERYWVLRDKENKIAEMLRGKHGRQVYRGQLPTHDIQTTLVGHYAYVLKDRKEKGKYQILEAIEIK